MKARIKWVEDHTFIGESGSGHKIVLGTAFGPDGRSPGPSPLELVLIGLGSCYDVVHILDRGREAIEESSLKPSARTGSEGVYPHSHAFRGEGAKACPSRFQSRNIARHRQ
jgi:putative redox protein